MNPVTRGLLGLLLILTACPALYGQALREEDPAERVMRNHAEFLNELSDRRRLNTFFPNEQSAFYGVPIRYVNSYRGNLTFVRRDLVTVGRIPIVLARVYDSSLRTGSDFGTGWQLSLAETIIRRSNGTLSYLDDSASQLTLVPTGTGGYALSRPGPTDIASVKASGDALRIALRSGWIKQFKQLDDRFLLTEIRDVYGNALTLHYRGQKLNRIEGQNGRFVAIERDASGRIRRIADDQRRTVSFVYDRRGLLETVIDLGGYAWRYEYDRLGRLERAIDPRQVATVEVNFGSDSRVRKVQILGAEYEYQYEEGITLIQDEAHRVTRIAHNRDGIATSLINPNGFVSELALDEQNRVKTLLHKGSPAATFTYGPGDRIDTLTRFEDTGAATLHYEYDDAGRPRPNTGNAASNSMLAYDPSGELLRKKQGESAQKFGYTVQGDLRSVTQAGQTTVYTHNADGQIELIESPRGTTRLSYFPEGRLQSIQFADGSVHQYRYNALGFRKRVDRSDGTRTTYDYDAAGNLFRSEGHQHTADSPAEGQTFDINANNQPDAIHFASGDMVKVTYDAMGNPETITTSDPQAPALDYLYDGTNRVVAVQDGDVISGSHLYEDTEPDLRIQMDDRTMRVAAGAVRQSASVGNLLSVMHTRPYGSILDTVRFDEATRTFDLPSDFGLSPPDAVAANSLTRRKLRDVDLGSIEARVNFDRPSNVMYLPPEYATISCATCAFTGVILSGNGVTGTLSVPAGSTVTLVATKQACGRYNVIYDWAINGVWMPWSNGDTQIHTFTTPGTHQVQAQGECGPCGIVRVGSLTVDVAPPCGANATLQTITAATIPSNRTRTKLGVGETTTVSLVPAPNCAVTWSLSSGSGAISAESGSAITFTAHDRASTATVTSTVNGIQRAVTYNVVEPGGVVMQQTVGTGVWHIQGSASVGFKGTPYITPDDVSFINIQVREGTAIGVGVGFYEEFDGLVHADGPFGGVVSASGAHPSEVNGVDTITTGEGGVPPYEPGTFTWPIPWLFKVGSGAEKQLTIVTHLQQVDGAGTATISKGGVSKTKNADDPSSGY